MSPCFVEDWFFFFSSRRRHTRCSRDWSSDVCSSDLARAGERRRPRRGSTNHSHHRQGGRPRGGPSRRGAGHDRAVWRGGREIGRASCRERVEISVVAVSLKKKKKKAQDRPMEYESVR